MLAERQMRDILSVSNLKYIYHTLDGETLAIDDLSFSVKQGEFLAIVGPSGCGKSTLLSLIAGLIQPTQGTIDLSNIHVGYMLQKDHLLEWRTTYKNASLGLDILHRKTEKEDALINSMLNTYGLSAFSESKPEHLSGGMRQRVALIRTLLLEPDLLLLDEPFSALDYQTRLEVSDDIWQILRKEKKTAILITHDISEAISMADRIIILTKRPAKIKQEIVPNLTIEGERTPLVSRNAPEFRSYFNQIWEELSHE